VIELRSGIVFAHGVRNTSPQIVETGIPSGRARVSNTEPCEGCGYPVDGYRHYCPKQDMDDTDDQKCNCCDKCEEECSLESIR
jgi:hypothetical protein